MKVCALTSGLTIPSANYRVRQYIPYLKNENVQVSEYKPLWNKFDTPSPAFRFLLKKIGADTPRNWNRLKLIDRYRAVLASNFYDITWVQKVLIPYHLTLELKVRKPMVFDLDDAIWMDEGKGFADKIVKHAELIFAGNNFLADWASTFNKNVVVVPTAVDTSKYKPGEFNLNTFVIGWIGTSGNFKYLKAIEPALEKFLKKRTDVRFKIIADKFPDELNTLAAYIDFVAWHPLTHAKEMQDFTVGIMPLTDDEWTKGKCSFKMLQYMSLGIAVVVSPFGMNKELLAMDNIGLGPSSIIEWFDALEEVYLNQADNERMGAYGRKLVLEKFSTQSVSTLISNQFKQILR